MKLAGTVVGHIGGALVFSVLAAASVHGQQAGYVEPPVQASRASAGLAYFTDVRLLDQSGRSLRFFTDVLAGRSVVVHSFYGDCTDVCPVILQKLKALQDGLGQQLGTSVSIISISVDPEHDTPARLRELSRSVGAGAGWIFLTGSKANLEHALFKLGFATMAREAHNPTLIVGNEPLGNWKKVAAMANVSAIAEQLRDVSTPR